MHNTIIYILLIVISASIAYISKYSTSIKVLLFFISYYLLFFLLECLHFYARIHIWDQRENTSQCYDWFEHYLKKNYGIIDGKSVYDYSENIYFDDYTISSAESLKNKYNLIFNQLKLSEGKTLLDCGCGIGEWMLFCKERGVNVIGLTLSKEQQTLLTKKGLTAYVQDYRVLNKEFVNKFDAISLLGSTEHVTDFSGKGDMLEKSYNDYKNLFSVMKQYLKPNGQMLLTVLVQCKPPEERNDPYNFIQSYILQRHYGGYYSKPEIISKAIRNNGFTINSIEDYTKDYHWISVAEPDHFGHWWVHWEEDPLDKIVYFFKGLATDPFLLHHWLYYAMDTWMWQFGGYQKTPLTDTQVKKAVANLKYFSISK